MPRNDTMGPFKRNLPNLLSALRIILIIPFVLALQNEDNLIMMISAASILITDFLDGRLARAWNVISKTGKIIDPLADKICTLVAAISLVHFRHFPLWLLLLIIIRDIGILLAGFVLMRSKQLVLGSNIPGKVAMVAISVCLIIYLLNIRVLMPISVAITVAALAVSSVMYSLQFIKLMAGSVA